MSRNAVVPPSSAIMLASKRVRSQSVALIKGQESLSWRQVANRRRIPGWTVCSNPSLKYRKCQKEISLQPQGTYMPLSG
jgi:hypothetical protein